MQITRGIVSHLSTLKLDGVIIPNGKAISLSPGEKMIQNGDVIFSKEPNGKRIEIAMFTVQDKNGNPIGQIQVEKVTKTDGVQPKAFNFN